MSSTRRSRSPIQNKMFVLLIDNYDSFTFNLVHYLEDLGARVTVWRNDAFELADVDGFDAIVISPGPGVPSQAGKTLEVIREFAGKVPILGICLGQQAIAEAFGGQLINLRNVHHGVAAEIAVVADEPLFTGLGKKITVGRYHSWSVERNLPQVLKVTSVDADGEIMSIRHRSLDVRGVQFHPESILTPVGKSMLANWLATN